jgi:hypothetical protein
VQYRSLKVTAPCHWMDKGRGCIIPISTARTQQKKGGPNIQFSPNFTVAVFDVQRMLFKYNWKLASSASHALISLGSYRRRRLIFSCELQNSDHLRLFTTLRLLPPAIVAAVTRPFDGRLPTSEALSVTSSLSSSLSSRAVCDAGVRIYV